VKGREASWPALDLFRGVAAVAMIANHAAVRWTALGAHATSNVAFSLGGLAPVLFFFATGFGTGVQYAAGAGGDSHRYGMLRKVVILCACEQIGRLAFGQTVPRFDFLSFIGLSILVLEPLRRASHGIAFAAVLAGSVLGARFLAAPFLRALGIDPTPWDIALGRAAVPWNSYPPLPWLAFPLLGFVLGAIAERGRARLREGALAGWCLAFGAAACVASECLSRYGLPVMRFGTMSAAYVPFAFGGIAIAGAAALSWQHAGLGAVGRGLALRGLPSLLLVPIHYWMLSLLIAPLRPADPTLFIVALSALVAASLATSRAIAALVTRLAASPQGPRWGASCLALGAFACVAARVAPIPHGAARYTLVYLAEVAVCALLVLPIARPRATAAGRVSAPR